MPRSRPEYPLEYRQKLIELVEADRSPDPSPEPSVLPSAPPPRSIPGSLYALSLNHPHQDDHDRDNEEDMNKSAHGIGGDKTQKPEDDQHDCNSPEHSNSPFA